MSQDAELDPEQGIAENVCPDCSGTGEVDSAECPRCQGTGVVREPIGGA